MVHAAQTAKIMYVKAHGVFILCGDQFVVQDGTFLQDVLASEEQVRGLFNGKEFIVLAEFDVTDFDLNLRFAFSDYICRYGCIAYFPIQAFQRGSGESTMPDSEVLFGVELIEIFQPLPGLGLIAGIFHVVRRRIKKGENAQCIDQGDNRPVNRLRNFKLHKVTSKH